MKDHVLNTLGVRRIRRFVNAVFILVVASVALLSCEEYESVMPVSSKEPVLSATTNSLELQEKNASKTAITFNWTAGTNHGTGAAIDYVLQFDKAGNNFASPVEVALGRGVYASSYSNADFNNLLRNTLQAAPETAAAVEVRVKSITADASVEPDYSNVASVTVTPYTPVTPTLYLLGSASPNGWDAGNALALTKSASNPTVFTYEGQLLPGEFKFITTKGEFLPSYQKGAGENQLVYRSEDSQPDDKFTVAEGGRYKITVNLSDMSLSLQQQSGPAYSQLWVVGSAAPNGWDLDNATPLVQSSKDPFVFTYTGLLAEGELKIATAKNWDAPFYRPTVGNAPTSSTTVQLSAGDPDNKWVVSQAGMYKVTLNLADMTISFQPVDLYLIGDAGPNGWDIATPKAMAKNGGVYTYTGPLNAGELKIAMFKGDWCGGDWINAATADQAITNTSFITTSGCDGPDNKWRVTAATAGNYTLTVNLPAGTITIVK